MSSDASLVTGAIQDLGQAVDAIASAIKDRPAAPIHVEVPPLDQPQINVHCEMPASDPPNIVVNVPEQPAPNVNVAAPNVLLKPEFHLPENKPVAYDLVIQERDQDGRILRARLTPV